MGGGSTPGSKRGNNRVFHITNGASVTIRDAIIQGGVATDNVQFGGGGILITQPGSKVTTINATITENTSPLAGGGVAHYHNSTFNAINTTITGNTAPYGGGVLVYESTFNASCTTISSNTATESVGGGVRMWDGTFNATDTTITENKAKTSGGGVENFSGTFNAYDTTIASNTANVNGGGVAVSVWGTFYAYEGTTIASNTANKSGGGVAVEAAGTFNAYEGTTIASNTANESGGGVAVSGTEYLSGTFIANNVTISGNQANGVLADPVGSRGNRQTDLAGGGGVAVLEWGEFYAEDSLIESNKAPNGAAGGVGVLGGTFTATRTEIKDNSAVRGGGVGVSEGAFETYSATITRNRAEGNEAGAIGGGVLVLGAEGIGIFNAYGTVIEENKAESSVAHGGGVAVEDGGTFNAYENTMITGNAAESGYFAIGGGVAIYDGGTFNAYEGTKITENKVEGEDEAYGGGVFVWGGTFNATTTTIEENTAKAEGGVGLAYGGGVGVASFEEINGIFNAYEGTTITENKVEGDWAYGGGVAVFWDGSFNAYAGTKIASNTAEGEDEAYGGGVAIEDGTFDATGTTIADNTAKAGASGDANGGGVAVGSFYAEEGIFNAYAGTTITGNTAEAEGESTASGGGVAVLPNGEFNAENVEISGNSAAVDGGGICWVYEEEGRINTSSHPWKENGNTPGDQEDDFSVNTNGEIQDDDEGNLVRVFKNTAPEGGAQMKVY